MSARKNIHSYLLKNGIKKYSGDELREVGKISDWARTIRQLRQDEIIIYDYSKADNTYNITFIGEYRSGTKRTGLSTKDRYRIRNRDGHRCQSCGKGVNDGAKLHVDHKIPVEWDGSNNDVNLWTLCSDCNLAKRAFFKDDFDSEIMKLVYKEKSGYQRLKVLFEKSPNKKFTPSILQGIAGIRDWTRAIRLIRDKEKINITWFKANEEYPNGYYSNI